jgi:hypothetical protein
MCSVSLLSSATPRRVRACRTAEPARRVVIRPASRRTRVCRLMDAGEVVRMRASWVVELVVGVFGDL